MEEIEMWRVANLLVKQRGDKATLHAAERVRTLLADGDAAGTLVWLRIFKAIEDLQSRAPPPGGSH